MAPGEKNKKLTIIAGPCSVDFDNIRDIYQIADIKVNNRFGRTQKAVFGTRVVGLKSRTALNKSGKNMGIDFPVFMKNLDLVLAGKPIGKLQIMPSVKIANKIIKATGLLVATEIIAPLIQLPIFEKLIPKNKLLIWNPSVNQLGWPIYQMGIFAKKNGWYLGLKNGKWMGDEIRGQTSMEKTWIGLSHYAGFDQPGLEDRLILIHRGVDIQRKGDYRSLPVHQAAKKVKSATRTKLFFDPSHSFGPILRHQIVDGVVEAMKMMVNDEQGEYLYDGVLIEVGHSRTDTEQHLTITELEILCCRLAKFRDLQSPL